LLALASCQRVIVNVGDGTLKDATIIIEPHIEKEKPRKSGAEGE
jgi:hypothetical protein